MVSFQKPGEPGDMIGTPILAGAFLFLLLILFTRIAYCVKGR